jgi:hypothetical protein
MSKVAEDAVGLTSRLEAAQAGVGQTCPKVAQAAMGQTRLKARQHRLLLDRNVKKKQHRLYLSS